MASISTFEFNKLPLSGSMASNENVRSQRSCGSPNIDKSDAAIRARQEAVDFARANVALSGLRASAEGEEIQQQWVRGEIGIGECIVRIMQYHRTNGAL